MKKYDGLALFSGGLDSILAARLLMEQGKKILCLHFTSPFFGDSKAVPYWEKKYGLEIIAIDISDDYCQMIVKGTKHGFGSALNPCVDCKIIMMQKAKELMADYDAKFLVSGEVLGQRPMSQRRDTLNVIRRDADVKDILLRPLCAKHMDETAAEASGLVDRSKLLGFSGRGRKDQLALAKAYGITDIPTAAGGCMLTEKENARRYWTLLKKINGPTANDFQVCNIGRQFWFENNWLCIGRNKFDNESIMERCLPTDYIFKLKGFAGPLGLGRMCGERPSNQNNSAWTEEELKNAASLVASYSPKAQNHAEETGEAISVSVTHLGTTKIVSVMPSRNSHYSEQTWDEVKDEIYSLKKTTN